MSLILDALRKARSLAAGSAPDRAPAYLKSFGFDAPRNTGIRKTGRLLAAYVLPSAVLAALIAAAVLYWNPRARVPAGPLPGEELENLTAGPIAPPEPPGTLPRSEAGAGAPEAARAPDPGVPEPAPAAPPPAPAPRVETGAAEALPPPPPPPEATAGELEAPGPPVPQAATDPEGTPEADASGETPPPAGRVEVHRADDDPFRLALFYQQSGQYTPALEYYGRVLAANPRDAFALNNIGLLHMAMGDTAEAIRSFRTSILADPDYDKAHNNLGTALMREGHPAEAGREFRRALELNPSNADAMINLGILSRQEGQVEAAKLEYLRALQIDPSSPEAHYNLAEIYEEQGEKGRAVRHLAQFLTLGSDRYPDRVDAVEQKIDELSRTDP